MLFWSCEGLMDNDKARIILLNIKRFRFEIIFKIYTFTLGRKIFCKSIRSLYTYEINFSRWYTVSNCLSLRAVETKYKDAASRRMSRSADLIDESPDSWPSNFTLSHNLRYKMVFGKEQV